MPIFAPNWIFSRFTTWIFGGVRMLLVGQCIYPGISSGISAFKFALHPRAGKIFK